MKGANGQTADGDVRVSTRSGLSYELEQSPAVGSWATFFARMAAHAGWSYISLTAIAIWCWLRSPEF